MTPPHGNQLRQRLLVLICTLTLISAAGAAPQEEASQAEREKQLEAFLADDTAGAFDILAGNPTLLSERSVQVKVYRSQRSRDPQVLAAAYRLCLQIPDLAATASMIDRRCNAAFTGSKADLKRLMLELVLQDPALKQDPRVVGLLNSALHSDDESLSDLAKELLAGHPELKSLPAIMEALPDASAGLPDYPSFKTAVNPIFVATGSDGRACVNCHKTRPILFLPLAKPNEDEEPVIRRRYRSVLLVIDLENPDESLILNKPTSPMPENPEGPVPPGYHTGGPRFEKGDETYNRILNWIRGHTQQ